MFKGSIVALVTPMHPDGRIDIESLCRLVDFHIENQTDAIVAVGTTGESATLDHEEHCEVIQVVVEHTAKRIPVIAGTGSNSTTEAIELSQCAKKAGVDGCLLVTPYYNKPTQEGLYQHYKTIADAVHLPHIVYNVPGRTACDLLPETVERLAKISNIVGIKEAVDDMARIESLVQLADANFAVLSGDDPTAMELILKGGQGVISVASNVVPKAMHNLCSHALAGKRAEAEAINQSLNGLFTALFVESNPIPVKWALYQMGLIPRGIRLPLLPLSEPHHMTVKTALEQVHALG